MGTFEQTLDITPYPGCRCSYAQLHYVGCSCEAENARLMTADVFLDGYASGKRTSFRYRDVAGFNPSAHAATLYGPMARVFSTRPVAAPRTDVTEEQARAMSARDNS